MEEVIARIKAYVLRYYPSILTALSITDDQLDLAVEEVVDRALAVMNREQLVAKYEQDLIDYDPEDAANAEFWSGYDLPIPLAVEKVIAKAVIGTARSFKDSSTATVGAIKSVSDNGQSVTYSDSFQNYFGSSNDSEIFGGTTATLKRYLIGDVFHATTC